MSWILSKISDGREKGKWLSHMLDPRIPSPSSRVLTLAHPARDVAGSSETSRGHRTDQGVPGLQAATLAWIHWMQQTSKDGVGGQERPRPSG